MPEDGAGEEARDEGVEDFGVEGVWVGYGEEEGVDSAESGDVVLFEGDDGRAGGDGGRRREDGDGWGKGYWDRAGRLGGNG